MYSSIASGLRTDLRCQFKESFKNRLRKVLLKILQIILFSEFSETDTFILLTTSRQKLRCQFSNENVQMASK